MFKWLKWSGLVNDRKLSTVLLLTACAAEDKCAFSISHPQLGYRILLLVNTIAKTFGKVKLLRFFIQYSVAVQFNHYLVLL